VEASSELVTDEHSPWAQTLTSHGVQTAEAQTVVAVLADAAEELEAAAAAGAADVAVAADSWVAVGGCDPCFLNNFQS
jgi:hypothetical protein